MWLLSYLFLSRNFFYSRILLHAAQRRVDDSVLWLQLDVA